MLVFDASLSLLVTYYIRLHMQRKRKYASSKAKWGNVIREDAFRQIERTVQTLLDAERCANCPACGGSGRRPDKTGTSGACSSCRGKGFRRGRVRRPFLVPYRGRNELFLGYNALTGEEIRLQGEECYRTTNIYGIQGSGKTKRAASLINKQLFLDDNTSAVYFSLKHADAEEIRCLAESNGWETHLMRGICLLNVFRSWSQLEQGLKMGMKAAGYRTRESFWFDRTLQLLREAYHQTLTRQPTARLGPTLARVLDKLDREAREGQQVKSDQIAVADISSYLVEFNDPLSPVRWLFDAGPDDHVPAQKPGAVERAGTADWSPLADQHQLIIVPPTGTSRAGVVAATALKYAALLWFEDHKHLWQEPNPAWRHRVAFIQDEGDNFVIVSETKDIDDVYATKTWRESGYSAWVYTQNSKSSRKWLGARK